MKKENEIILLGVEQKIFIIRKQKVMIDSHLAELYQISTKVFLQSVKRNKERFPDDFCFQLNNDEAKSLRSQIVTSKIGRGGRRYSPYVFTEHGVSMPSSVLRSERAVQMNIFIVRAFIKLRQMIATSDEFRQKLAEIEQEQQEQGNLLAELCETVGKIIEEGIRPHGPIGFQVGPSKN